MSICRMLVMGAALTFGVMASTVMAQVKAIDSAGVKIVNGWWSGIDSTAKVPGEMNCELTATGFPSVYTGVPESLLPAAETVIVESGFAFSSLESLRVPNDTTGNTAYDTIYFRYAIQNQGNVTDSFSIKAWVLDTSDAKYFTPVGFAIVKDTHTVHGGTVAGSNNVVDSAWYGKVLAQEGVDTFFVRIILPGPLNAADGDSLRFNVKVSDHHGTGVWDAWPDTIVGMTPQHVKRPVIDTTTLHQIWFTHNDPIVHSDTLWDYGDTQSVMNYLTISAPILRLKKTVDQHGSLPGDTLTYHIFYDNDGSAPTKDTVNIVDMLPLGVMFLDTVLTHIDSNHGVGQHILVSYKYGNTWLTARPTSAHAFDTLKAINGIRFKVPPGIGAQDTTGDHGTDTKTSLVADGDTLANGKDAGFVTFKVRIR